MTAAEQGADGTVAETLAAHRFNKALGTCSCGVERTQVGNRSDWHLKHVAAALQPVIDAERDHLQRRGDRWKLIAVHTRRRAATLAGQVAAVEALADELGTSEEHDPAYALWLHIALQASGAEDPT